MKESLSDIIKKHRNWYSVSYDLNINDATKLTEIDIEMSDAANLYAESLHTDRWQIEVKNDIHDIFHEPPGTRSNREMAERHTAIVSLFVSAVKRALINHAFDISQLDRVTQWRFEEVGRGTKIENDLTRDEADRLLHSMSKQGFRAQRFRELCSDLYTVLAYKVEASQTMQPGTPPAAGQTGGAGQEPESDTPPPTDIPIGVLPGILDTPKARRVFGKAIEKGYMEKDATMNKFEWNGVTPRGRNVQLAYLSGKIYGYCYSQTYHSNVGNQFPEAELKELFGINNLQQSLFQFYDRPATKRQKWIDTLDTLFD